MSETPAVQALMARLNFGAALPVRGRASIADLFKPGERCGIYVLHFTTGECYIGQAVDVTRRYVQHCKTHGDIAEMSFKQLPVEQLDTEEREAIWACEQQRIALRNISLTSVAHGETDFELIMPREQQERWLGEVTPVEPAGERSDDADLRRKYGKRYQTLTRQPGFTDLVSLLHTYMRLAIPLPRQSERAFWSCSCLPGGHHPDVEVYTRINIYWQEVLTIGYEQDQLWCSWHLARSPLEAAFGPRLRRLIWRYPQLEISDHRYQPGGSDQIALSIDGAQRAQRLLREPAIIAAMRLFNLRQMNKGPCTFSRYHCFDLVDQCVGA